MKKTLFLFFSLLLTALSFGQASITIDSGPSNVEVGVPYNYRFTFIPQYPYNTAGVQADTYIITEWVVLTSTNLSGTIPRYINTPSNQSYYYHDGTYNNVNPKIVPIQWGNGSNSTTDIITVKVSGIYRISSTGETVSYFNLQPQATKDITIQRLTAPIISGPSTVSDCSQANVSFGISNATNANQYLWTISPAGSIVSSATGSTVTVSPPTTGTFTVGCTVKRSGANPLYSEFGAKAVTRNPFTSSATITGNTTVCNNVTYSVSGLLAGQTVSWSLSNGTAATLSPSTGTSTTVTKTGGGAAYVIATIQNSCGTQTVDKYLAIFVGAPQTYSLVRASNETCDIKYHYVPLEIPNRNPLITYTFNIAPIPGVTITKITQTYNGIVQDVLRVPKTFIGIVDFTILSSNSCGSLNYYSEQEINSCNNIGRRFATDSPQFTTYPNPAKEYINIALLDEDSQTSKLPKIYAELFDAMGVKKSSASDLFESKKLYVGDLKKGLYFLKVTMDGQTESHKIMIE